MRLTTGAVVAASGFNKMLSQSIGLVYWDEHQLVILHPVGDGMCCGYGDESAALYLSDDDPDALITSSRT